MAESTLDSLRRPEDRLFRVALPVAVLAWLVIVLIFGRFVATPEVPNREPEPIEARIVELPEEPLPKSEPAPPPPRPVPPPPKPVLRPLPKRERAPRPEPPPPPAPPAALQEPPKSIEPVPPAESAPPPPAPAPPPPPPLPPPAPSTSTFGAGHTAARAIYQPLPKIPGDLQSEALAAVAVARFHIETDGSVTVELIKPTPNPKVNRIILDTLKTWKFFPEILEGKPVPSTQELKISIDIS